jgi:hypothetical protein
MPIRSVLSAILLLLFAGAAQADDAGTQWRESVDKSPMDDSPIVTLWVGADEPMSDAYGGSTTPTLVVRCRENSTSIFVNFDQYITTGDVDDEHQIRYRLDSKPPVSAYWGVSTDFEALGVWEGAVRLVQEVAGAKRLILQTIPYGRSSVTVSFDVSGLEKRLPPLAKACNWPGRRAEAAPAKPAPAPSAQEKGSGDQQSEPTARPPARTLTHQELSNLVTGTLISCWNVDPAQVRQSGGVNIEMKIEVGANGRIVRTEVVDKARMARDRTFRIFAESAQRAAMNPRCRTIIGMPAGTSVVTLNPISMI